MVRKITMLGGAKVILERQNFINCYSYFIVNAIKISETCKMSVFIFHVCPNFMQITNFLFSYKGDKYLELSSYFSCLYARKLCNLQNLFFFFAFPDNKNSLSFFFLPFFHV